MRVLKWLRNICFIALVAVAAISCFAWAVAPHYFDLIVFRPGDWKKAHPQEITVADAKVDLAVLHRALRTGYVGYDYFQEQGTDWDALFARAEASLAEHPTISFCDFALTVNKLLRSVDDQHLRIWYANECKLPRPMRRPLASEVWFRREGEETFVVAPAPDGVPAGSRLIDCEGCDVGKDLHYAARKVNDQWQFGYRLIYLKQKRRDKITCRFQKPNGKRFEARVAMSQMYKYSPEKPITAQTGETTYIQVGTFNPENETDMEPFINSAAEAASSRAIVMDLRGNFGGSDRYFYIWSRDLFQGKKIIGGIARLTSQTTRQARINLATEEWAFRRDTVAFRMHYTLEALQELATQIALGAINLGAEQKKLKQHSGRHTGRAERPFTGKMLLIADRSCASACEGAVTRARDIFDALIAGTDTRGTHVFIEPHPYRLPKSGLVVRIAHKMMTPSEQENQQFCEVRGFMPDVWIDLRDDAATAIALGHCLADAECAGRVLPGIAAAGERHRDISMY